MSEIAIAEGSFANDYARKTCLRPSPDLGSPYEFLVHGFTEWRPCGKQCETCFALIWQGAVVHLDSNASVGTNAVVGDLPHAQFKLIGIC